jgi:hypothetical protein
MEIIMNTNIRSHQALTATQVLKSTGVANVQARKSSIVTRIGRCLIAPALVAVLMLGAHWSVFGSQAGAELQVMEEEAEADSYFPPEYAFRSADFDDPSNYR